MSRMKKRDVCGVALLFIYLCGVGYLTGPSMYQLLIGRLPEPRLELVPFADIVNVLTDPIFGINGVFASGAAVNIVGNILMFVPLGILLPVFWTYFRKMRRTVLCGAAVSVSIEFIQLFAGGVTSVDDVMLNTLGTALGFLLAMVFIRGRGSKRTENRSAWAYPLGCWIAVIAVHTLSDFAFLMRR